MAAITTWVIISEQTEKIFAVGFNSFEECDEYCKILYGKYRFEKQTFFVK